MKTKNFIFGIAALAALTFFTSCEKESDEMKSTSEMSVAEYAISDPNFSTLVQALTKADLAGALSGEGNFTVFAPTNAAFSALFAELKVGGIADLSAETLKPILLYHVLGEEKKSTSLMAGYYNTISPSQNSFLSLKIDLMSGVKVNSSAKVIAADVDVKNGVIHAIDKVLLPPSVVDLAIANENFSILVQAVVKAGLAGTLSGAGPFTIFAPTNAAFQALFTQLGISGINDLTAQQLVPILTYHVVSGNVRSTSLSAGSVSTLNGSINITLTPSPAINNNSKIIATDVQGSNGVIHVIDKVLLPAKK